MERDLFGSPEREEAPPAVPGAPARAAPLADRMRPRALEEVLGQDHLLGEGKVLRRAIERDELRSAIFWGPPGTGKTTLARIIAARTNAHFITLSAPPPSRARACSS